MRRGSRGISGVVAAVILALIFVAFVSFVIVSMNYIEKLTQLSTKVIEYRSRASALANAIHGWWIVEGSDLVINVSSSYPYAALITALGVVFDNGSSLALARNVRETVSGYIVVRDATGSISVEPLSLPIAIGPGYSMNITLQNVVGSGYPRIVTLTLSASPIVVAIPLRNYFEVYPPSGGAVPNASYSIVYAPIPVENYTVAVLGYNGTLTDPQPPTGFSIDVGNLIRGSIDSLQSIDGDYIAVSPSYTTVYRFPAFSEWSYYKPINITENTGTDLVNYTVKIVLNSTNFDFSKANPDGSDIRFVLSDGVTVLDYWIEKWDSTNEQAVIWVKIPRLPGGRTVTIYMLYGNPSATFDPQHYGLTKVMEKLPASDGPNYRVQYQEWIMPTNLFDPNQGTSTGWSSNDDSWLLNLPFSFPYYSATYDAIYVHSNGFVALGWDPDGDWYSSSETDLENNRMIAPFWADLDPYDIYVNTSYVDQYGEGVYIRWYTTFCLGIGEQNFAVVLYRNGLIRFDYGTIYGYSWTDDTPVIGISFGDGVHYTITSYNGLRYPSNYNSIMLWPRKVATTEPTVSVDPNDYSNAMHGWLARVSFGWSNVAPITLVNASLYLELYLGFSTSATCIYRIYENSSGSWNLVEDGSVALNQWIDLGVEIYRFFDSGTVGLSLEVFCQNLNYVLWIDYVGARFETLGDPLLGIAINGSSTLYLYDLATRRWIGVPLDGSLLNPAIAFDYQRLSFVIANGSELLLYDPFTNGIQTIASLAEPSRGSAIVAAMRSYYIYVPGEESSTIYVYSRDGTLENSANLPEALGRYTVSAYDPRNDVLYILVGGSGNLYSIKLQQSATPTIDRIVVSPSIPTIYPVGLDYCDGYLWLIARGGGIHRIDTVSGTASPLSVQVPLYPVSEGDRLACYGNKLIFVREDGTNEVWIVQKS